MKRLLGALVIFVSFSAAADDAFHYDRHLATALSREYLSAFNRQHPVQSDYTDATHGLVSSAIAAHDRHLVFVTFAGSNSAAGYYVELELCKETNLLTVVNAGAVDNVQAYRDGIMRINSKTYVASPAVCPAEVP